MSAHKFGIGDVVKLKSGGPDMTIDAKSERVETVLCKWFVGRSLRAKVFHPAELELVKATDPAPTA
jgi:uncharacterized protein YodC (DUF2158 family)